VVWGKAGARPRASQGRRVCAMAGHCADSRLTADRGLSRGAATTTGRANRLLYDLKQQKKGGRGVEKREQLRWRQKVLGEVWERCRRGDVRVGKAAGQGRRRAFRGLCRSAAALCSSSKLYSSYELSSTASATLVHSSHFAHTQQWRRHATTRLTGGRGSAVVGGWSVVRFPRTTAAVANACGNPRYMHVCSNLSPQCCAGVKDYKLRVQGPESERYST